MAQAKHRSPNYPRLAFDVALDKTRAIYKQQHKHAASKEVVAHALGFTSFSSGSSKAVIAALKYYGLLEPAGEGFAVSADANRAMELPKEDPQRIDALNRMVFAPTVFAELRNRFRDQLPLSARHTLITKAFAPNAADDIIRIYRSNLNFIRGQCGDADVKPAHEYNDEPDGNDLASSQPAETSRSKASPDTQIDRVLQFQISEDADVRIHFRGRPNRSAIKKLIALLELSIDTFPTA